MLTFTLWATLCNTGVAGSFYCIVMGRTGEWKDKTETKQVNPLRQMTIWSALLQLRFMTVTIQFSDEQAAALQAKSSAQGLSLERWLQSLAGQDTQTESGSVIWR